MVKKLAVILLALIMAFSSVCVFASNEKKVYKLADVTETGTELKTNGEYFTVEKAQGWFGIKNVDLTGVGSIGLTGKNPMHGWTNAEIFRIKIDDPMGEAIGFVAFNETTEDDSDVTCRGNISAVSGKHDLYFVTTLSKPSAKWQLNGITLYTDKVVRETVSDDYIVDDWSDTWAAVDDYGRKVADYEEAGPVKEGDRYVGMMYWNWHTGADSNYNIVIPEVIKKDPEARYDVFRDSWYNNTSKVWWGQPVYGFYTSQDYWVYKKQFEILSNAGVDALFMDYTNGGCTFTENLITLMEALLECKKEGLDIPKISWYGAMGPFNNNTFDETLSFYYNVYCDDRYRDLWFTWDGKPFAADWSTKDQSQEMINQNDKDIIKTQDLLEELLELRHFGARYKESEGGDLSWLETYPQYPRGNKRADGRVEMFSVGTAINESTVPNVGDGVFSDPYSRGRAFSEAFGEDYSADNGRKPYFFREQAALALEYDPAFVYIDGWNEWNTVKYDSYGSYKAGFC